MTRDGAVWRALSGAFVAACADRGHDVDPTLMLSSVDGVVGDVVVSDPWDLGTAHEALTRPEDQTRRGAWYTPRPLAEMLVRRTVDAPGTVLDPACGGGVFLLAAADRLVELGASPAEVVSQLVVAMDIDPLAAAVAQAALWWWGAERGVTATPRVEVADALVGPAWPATDFVVGNPPFLGQLRTATTIAVTDRDRLRARFGDSVGAYTDPSALFLLAAVEAVNPDGVVTLIQPQSVLAARDAAGVRRRVTTLADMEGCWFDDGTSFAAAVEVCAPTLRRAATPTAGTEANWAELLADHVGIPAVDLDAADTLSSLAEVVTGFRDEYYGLVGAVTEGGTGPRLVTSGAVDPFRLRSDRPVTFAKRRWVDPRVEPDRATPRAAAWVRRQWRPSVLVASQTRIVECVADTAGEWVIGVPGVAIVPHDAEHVWHVAAAVAAPCVSAWMLRRSVGTGMSGDALRPSGPLVASVPLPVDAAAWDRAAALARAVSSTPTTQAWLEFGEAADGAHGVEDEALLRWWWSRHPASKPGPG